MSKLLLLVSLVVVELVPAQVEITGYVKNYDAIRLNENYDYLVLRNRLRLDFNYLSSERGLGYASFDIRNDHLINHNDLELNLRELYMDLYFDNYDLRVGKQQIVWGEADGLFITDIINPLDLREFILADFEDIRMGVNSIKAQVYWGDNRLETIWIPQFVPAKFSQPGEPWAFHTVLDEITSSIPDSLVMIDDIILPEKRLKNSEYGFRYSTRVRGYDLALSYFHTWDDYPIFQQIYHPVPNPFIVSVIPGYDRYNIVGGTFSTNIGALVIRGEGALYRKRNFYSVDVSDGDRVVRKDFLNYLFGGEWSPGEMFISGQWIQEIILDYDALLVDDRVSTTVTLFLSQALVNETIKPEAFIMYNFTRKDYLGRFDVKLYPFDGMEIILAADILGGEKKNTLFSQFDKNDNAYVKIKYSF